MTSRMSLAYVAIAALALITSGVRAAYALSFCDIYPNRCQYTPSGKGYYYPQGYRLPSEMPGFGGQCRKHTGPRVVGLRCDGWNGEEWIIWLSEPSLCRVRRPFTMCKARWELPHRRL
jgi:hypothetical protein